MGSLFLKNQFYKCSHLTGWLDMPFKCKQIHASPNSLILKSIYWYAQPSKHEEHCYNSTKTTSDLQNLSHRYSFLLAHFDLNWNHPWWMFAKPIRLLFIFILVQYFWIVGPDPSRKMERLPAPLIVQNEIILANMEKTFFRLLSYILSLMQVMNSQDPFPFSFLLFLEAFHPIYSTFPVEM